MDIYATEECVICLEGAPRLPFAPCGHQCCCGACGAAIRERRMPCPLCRAEIAAFAASEADVVLAAPAALVCEFKKTRRAEYISRLPSRAGGLVVKAGFTGRGKLARSVSGAMGSELEQRERETAGGDRMARARSVLYTVAGDSLTVDYKLGRRAVREAHPYAAWEAAAAELAAGLDGELLESVLELAIEHPQYYWLARYHHRQASDLEPVLVAAGLMQSAKRRRRT